MQVWRGIDEVPKQQRSVVTIGNFDGVHLGHRAVLGATVAAGRTYRLPTVALTFDPHPATVHRPEEAPQLLTGLTDRLELMAATGLDAILLVNYTLSFARTSATDFVTHYLVEALGARCVVVGADTRFGSDNSGTSQTLTELGATCGFDVEVVPDLADVGERRWSSTWARELITSGHVEKAAAILGRPHRMRGVVVAGERRGRDLGFPTANLAKDAAGTIPADGVYAGWMVRAYGQRLPVALSIGTNPTFTQGRGRSVEAHVLWREDLELYGEEIVVEFTHHLRPTLRFDGSAELVEQMAKDVAQAGSVLGVTAGGEQ